MARFKDLFPARTSLIAMIHVRALPGTPAYSGEDSLILEKALEEARIYRNAGVHGIMLENMHDTPYVRSRVGPEVTAFMAVVASQVKKESGLPCGVQVLAGANREAFAVAKAANLDFVRCEGFVFAHVADEGLLQSDAGELLRYRKQINADNILVFTDIKKKHSSHAITADIDLGETAKAAGFFRSDGLIVTGTSTGKAAAPRDLQAVKAASKLPVLIGSGITADNVQDYAGQADALIVGSSLKKGGHWAEEVDPDRVSALVQALS